MTIVCDFSASLGDFQVLDSATAIPEIEHLHFLTHHVFVDTRTWRYKLQFNKSACLLPSFLLLFLPLLCVVAIAFAGAIAGRLYFYEYSCDTRTCINK